MQNDIFNFNKAQIDICSQMLKVLAKNQYELYNAFCSNDYKKEYSCIDESLIIAKKLKESIKSEYAKSFSDKLAEYTDVLKKIQKSARKFENDCKNGLDKDFEKQFEDLLNKMYELQDSLYGWEVFLGKIEGELLFDKREVLLQAIDIMHDLRCTKVLDIGAAFDKAKIIGRHIPVDKYFDDLVIDSLFLQKENENISLPDNRFVAKLVKSNIYNNIFWGQEAFLSYSPKNSKVKNTYDVSLLLYKDFNEESLSGLSKDLEEYKDISRYVLIEFVTDTITDKIREELSNYGRFIIIGKNYKGLLILLDREVNNYKGKVRIYTVCHKAFNKPSYPMYLPIHAGRKGKKDLGYIGDDKGDNISEYNPYINECTAIYNIWKNVKDFEYIGINHYRRYFSVRTMNRVSDWFLLEKDILDYFEDYDIILKDVDYSYPETIEEHLIKTFKNTHTVYVGLQIARNILSEKYPERLENFDRVMKGHTLYLCNLFVMPVKLFDDYCDFLFPFIIELTDRIDEELNGIYQNDYDKRIAGFIAERMFTVWLLDKDLRVKELPVISGGN